MAQQMTIQAALPLIAVATLGYGSAAVVLLRRHRSRRDIQVGAMAMGASVALVALFSFIKGQSFLLALGLVSCLIGVATVVARGDIAKFFGRDQDSDPDGTDALQLRVVGLALLPIAVLAVAYRNYF